MQTQDVSKSIHGSKICILMGKSMERKREIPQSGAGQRGLEYGGHPCCRPR